MKSTLALIALALGSGSLSAVEPKPLRGCDGETQGRWQVARETIVPAKAAVPGQLVCPSPDGRYAISWPGRGSDEADVANHLVDLKTGKAIHLIFKGGYLADCEGKNHGGLSALWRADGRAVIVRSNGKWGPRAVRLLIIGKDGKVEADDLTEAARRELVKIFKKQAAELWKQGGFDQDGTQGFVANLSCDFCADGKTLSIMAEGETNPKEIPGNTPRIVANLTGTFDLATRTLAVKSGKVTEAKVLKDE